MVLPVLDPDNSNHYLSTEAARKLIKSKPITFAELKGMIPNSKLDSAEKKAMKMAKANDKAAGKHFHYSKVKDVASCDYCGAFRCIFSNKAVGQPGGPSQTSLDRLRSSLEEGHVCGRDLKKRFREKGFYIKTSICCGEPIEAQYYNPPTGQKGGRITTSDICAVCWSDEDIVSPTEIRTRRDVGGKVPLPTCQLCLDLNVEIPCSGGRQSNQQQKNCQNKKRQKEQHENAVANKKEKEENKEKQNLKIREKAKKKLNACMCVYK